MKRIIILILSVLMLISLFAACSEEKADKDNTSSKTESVTDTSDEKSETTPSENSDETSSTPSADTSSESPDESVDAPSVPDEPDTPDEPDEPDTPDEPVEYDPTPRDLEYTYYDFSEVFTGFKELSNIDGYDSDNRVLVVDSYDVCKQILTLNKDLKGTDSSETYKFLNGLDKDYFNKKIVLLFDDFANHSGYTYEITNVHADENGVTTYITEIDHQLGFDMLCYHVIAVELDKSDILGCDSFNAEVETVQYDPTPRDLEYTEKIIPAMFNGDSKHSIVGNETPTPIVIKSFDDVDTLLSNVSINQSEKLVEYLNDLPSSFFSEKIILVNDFTHGIDYTDCGVIGVRADENGVTVKYTYKLPSSGHPSLPAEYPCVCVIELDKSDILGCESFNAEVETVQYDPTPRELEYTAHISDESSYGFEYISSLEDYDSETCILVIDSYDICKKVLDLQKNVDEKYSETVTFLKSLDKSYFNSKTILLIDAQVPTSGYSFDVSNVRADVDGVTVECIKNYPIGPFVNQALGYFIIAIELDKSDILGCDSFNAEFEVIYPAA